MDNTTRDAFLELVHAQLATLRVLSTLIAAAPEGAPADRLQDLLNQSAEHLEAAVKVING